MNKGILTIATVGTQGRIQPRFTSYSQAAHKLGSGLPFAVLTMAIPQPSDARNLFIFEMAPQFPYPIGNGPS